LPAYYLGVPDKLAVTLINTDMQQPLLRVYLRMKIASSTLSLVNPGEVYTPVIELPAGLATQLSGNDLSVYFNRTNLRISGAQTEFNRTQMLPDNLYRFHFEVYEATTHKLLSNPHTGYAMAMIAAGDPPILNLPEKGARVVENHIPSVFFSWTPRHMNSPAAAYHTEYELTLVEIYDRQTPPESAFLYSRPLYTERVKSTSFVHTSAHPVLLPWMRYAWRVRAVARDGVDDASIFRNDGYSPIYWFDYVSDCRTVQVSGAVYENGRVKITWDDTGALEYTVEYRKKGAQKWYTGTNISPNLCTIYNLQPGADYEYRIGTRCMAGDTYGYTNVRAFHIPEREERSAECGILPDAGLSNQTPATSLPLGLPVMAGDFPVFITKVSGSGRFTGEGYAGIPYLQHAQVAVTFKDIVVNTDNQLISGWFETAYDAVNGNLLMDIDQTLTGGDGVGDIRSDEEKATFTVDYTLDPNIPVKPFVTDDSKDEIKEGDAYIFTKGENGKYQLVLTDNEGNEHTLETDSFPFTIKDKSNNVYEVTLQEDNSVNIEISNYNDINSGQIIATYSVSVYQEDVLKAKVIDPEIFFFTKYKKKTLNLKLMKDKQSILGKWFVNDELKKQDSIYTVDLSQINEYNIVVKGISDSVHIDEDCFTDTLVVFKITVTEKPAIKVEIDPFSYYEGEFGFDAYTLPSIKETRPEYKAKVADAYFSLKRGQPVAEFRMQVAGSSFPDHYRIELRCENIKISPNIISNEDLKKSKDKIFNFSIRSDDEIEDKTLTIVGVSDSSEEILFTMNCSVKSEKSFSVKTLNLLYLITNDDDSNRKITEDFLNKIDALLNKKSFNQAFIKWNITLKKIDMRDLISMRNDYDTLYSEYKGDFAKMGNSLSDLLKKYRYTPNQEGFIKFIKETEICNSIKKEAIPASIMDQLYNLFADNYKKGEFLAFILNRKNFSGQDFAVPGAAGQGRYYSIFLYDAFDYPYVFAHELGHNLGLEHPFKEFSIPKGSSTNFMDYGRSPNMFWYWQWSAMRLFEPEQ
jgi:hypothetical protein